MFFFSIQVEMDFTTLTLYAPEYVKPTQIFVKYNSFLQNILLDLERIKWKSLIFCSVVFDHK